MKAGQTVDIILGVLWTIVTICFGIGMLEVSKVSAMFMAAIIAIESFKNVFQRKV